jgi:hypothetical protein
MSDDFPDQGFANSQSFLLGIVDNFAQISFTSVFHKDINILFGAVKETFLESDDIRVI